MAALYRLPEIVEAEQVENLKKSNNISEIAKINLITKCLSHSNVS